jgi:hypothetical protein
VDLHILILVKLLGMRSWKAKASQIADSGISNFTFLRSIGTAASVWPIPLLRGTDATFSFSPGSLQVSLCHCGDLSPMALATGSPPMATPESRAKIRSACCRMWMLTFDDVKLRSLPTCPTGFPQLLTDAPQAPSFPSKNSADIGTISGRERLDR